MYKRTIKGRPEARFVRKAEQTASGINIDDALRQSYTDYNFMGDWVPDNEYHPNDLVIDTTDNNQYVCEVAVNGSDIPPSQDYAHWQLFLKGGLNVSHIIIDPPTAEVGTFANHEYEILTENSLNYISRAGEIYRLFDVSNASYLTYCHISIDTSQSSKPAVLKVIRVNIETHTWELISKTLSTL